MPAALAIEASILPPSCSCGDTFLATLPFVCSSPPSCSCGATCFAKPAWRSRRARTVESIARLFAAAGGAAAASAARASAKRASSSTLEADDGKLSPVVSSRQSLRMCASNSCAAGDPSAFTRNARPSCACSSPASSTATSCRRRTRPPGSFLLAPAEPPPPPPPPPSAPCSKRTPRATCASPPRRRACASPPCAKTGSATRRCSSHRRRSSTLKRTCYSRLTRLPSRCSTPACSSPMPSRLPR
mmetsp:Transcript_38239/g.89894  ORF Transcript_38239/g.89894 Transcript_38239/m.89894 type:complete len:244 (-) Transcript_38239:681-1412(-)